MATLEDIANRLNITKGTVSKALNGAPDVSESLRQTVLETAVEMNYARALRKKNAPCLCVFIQYMVYAREGDFGYDIIMSFRRQAEAAGFRVEVVDLNPELQEQYTFEEYMLKYNLKGALLLGLSLRDPWLTQMKTCHTPAVLYDNSVLGNPRVSQISVNDREAMELVVQHLGALGHRRIGYLSSAMESYIFRHRYESFVEAVKEISPDWDDSLMGCSYHTIRCVQKELPRLLEQGVTAVVCSHDALAQAAITHSFDLGLRVPEDLSIVGYDDLAVSAFSTPPLTTVRQDRKQLGSCAFLSLQGLLNGADLGLVMLHARLIERGSTGPVH